MIAELCYIGWQAFYPLLLRARGFSPETIGVIFAVYGIFITGVRPATGFLAARFSRPMLLILSTMLVAAGLVLAVVAARLVAVVASVALIGLGFGLVYPITMVLATSGAEDSQLGGRLAARFTVMMVGGMLGPVVTGAAAAVSLSGAIAMLAVAAAAGAAWIAATIRRPEPLP
jgi:MFS family permease